MGAEEHEGEALHAPEKDRPPIDDAIGAVEGGAGRLDAVGGKVGSDHRRDGEQVAVNGHQHAVDLGGDRLAPPRPATR